MPPEKMPQPHGLGAIDPRQRYSIPEVLSYLRVGRTHFYNVILPGITNEVIREHSRVFLPGVTLERLCAPPKPGTTPPPDPAHRGRGRPRKYVKQVPIPIATIATTKPTTKRRPAGARA